VGAVNGDDFANDGSRVDEELDELVEDPLIGFFTESVSEVGEEAVAGGVSFSESAGSG